jgi:hypothetical protein
VVSAGAVVKTELGYRAVGRELLKLRRSGRVPYGHITDGTRLIRKPRSWNDLDQMLDDASSSYRRALWHDQQVEVMVLSEKDAISGVVYPVTSRWDVPLGIVRGYSSETFAYEVAEDIAEAPGKVWVYQLGDHDASGVDAWRAFTERVGGFLGDMVTDWARWVEFERLAVTPEQIEWYQLPTRPAKATDSRAAGFAGECVEVDALPPSVLRQLVEDAITQHIDPEALRLTRIAEQSEREVLLSIKGRR